MRIFTGLPPKIWLTGLAVAILFAAGVSSNYLESSSHREAPIIANDPLADNTDVYAFRSPTNPNNVVIVANFIPFQLPHGGPNYYNFGEDIAYDIHVKNNARTDYSDVIYRFEFKQENEDPTTFFKIRLGKENVKATYTINKSLDGGKTWSMILDNGRVAPYNVGPRSIESAVGLNSNYDALMRSSIMSTTDDSKVFCGPVDDPFFIDVGGIMDLGNIRAANAPDGLAKLNVHTIAMEIPIYRVTEFFRPIDQAFDILDSRFTIGVWASASRKQMTVRNTDGTVTQSGPYVQVSRLGMPLTNEVIIPIGRKDEWNATPSTMDKKDFEQYFVNPELALYMDDSKFGGAVPGFAPLRIQTKSLGRFDFRNGAPGLYPLYGNPATFGTALDPNLFGNYLLRPNQPRSVDLLPLFMTGVPNLPPYQLATGKGDNPLAKGKPFINNFLPTFGDMLRINMAVPVTPRNSPDFSNLGLVQAAVLGLTDPRFNTTTDLQFIPNMDGFPNGRRLEDDVTRIELQAVSGVVLAAIGLWYDDYVPGGSPVTQDLVDVLSFTEGVDKNDKEFQAQFPYLAKPWEGFRDGHIMINCDVNGNPVAASTLTPGMGMKMATPDVMLQKVDNYPNPARDVSTFRFKIGKASKVNMQIYNEAGVLVASPLKDEQMAAGVHEKVVNVKTLKNGLYFARIQTGKDSFYTVKFIVNK
ncbi:DUF4331 family protein [Rufibacter glacialis]|uniref:DUF4331 domain-containing protein n=1 Tax=Rufibacter glacialis TaxID=1259555 RepID=A0A5M8QH86_9BACT|nr:DUF4331 family protein [Rufibacter glacialis]KAA6434344.1 DUF4331 domain-containing protein [Rufibacter glacialis]GGK68711.1 hypothetical protein GCM10011405_16050 [Rufibacter glacialis]